MPNPNSPRYSLPIEVKAAAKKAGRIVAGGIIDSLGRKWNPSLHPRDSQGRFIETGGIATAPMRGIRGRVTKVSDEEAEVEVAQGVKIRVIKSTISQVLTPKSNSAND